MKLYELYQYGGRAISDKVFFSLKDDNLMKVLEAVWEDIFIGEKPINIQEVDKEKGTIRFQYIDFCEDVEESEVYFRELKPIGDIDEC